jgi:isoleucyl-tRNA synthetase
MSNWYVRRSRSRFWAHGMEQDKINAYMTLYKALTDVSRLAAPMIPFMTEEIYQNLVRGIDPNAKESIHLCDYPAFDEEMIDHELEEHMKHVLDVVVLGRAARNESGIKNRQPIGRMLVKAPYDIPEFYTAIILDELNVKSLEMTDDADGFVSYNVKPNLPTVGPKYGKQLGGIRSYLASADGSALVKELKEKGNVAFEVGGVPVVLEEGDLLILTEQSADFETQSDGKITVVLDKQLSPELLEEGFVRELISKIQTMRKEAGYEVMDRITVFASGNEKLEQIMLKNKEQIMHDVMALSLVTGETDGYTKDWKINQEPVTLGVRKQ